MFSILLVNPSILNRKGMFLAIDKPTRITSFGVIRRIKKIFPGQKIGHSGTLDPLATGLMILAIGKDTKNLTKLIGLDKSYIATIDFSIMTDTWDIDYRENIENGELKMEKGEITGVTIGKTFLPAPKIVAIKKLLDSIIPSAELPIPSFSAKKKEGKRLYAMARKGHHALEYKIMKIMSYDIISYDFPKLTLQLDVGSGTYIRSIAYRLGQQLGLGGTLVQLRRKRIGAYDIEKIPHRKTIPMPEQSKELVIKYVEI